MTGLTARVEAFSDGVFVFALSCCVILIMWVNHHELMRMVCAVDYPFFFANGFALLSVTFVPFPTAVLARHLATAEAKTAATLYTWGWLFLTIVRGGLLRPEVHLTTIARIRNAYVAGPVVYVIATGVAFLRPVVGLVLNASLWLRWIRLCYHSRYLGAEAG